MEDLGGQTEVDTFQRSMIDRATECLIVLNAMSNHVEEGGIMKGEDLAPCLKASFLAYQNTFRLALISAYDHGAKQKGKKKPRPLEAILKSKEESHLKDIVILEKKKRSLLSRIFGLKEQVQKQTEELTHRTADRESRPRVRSVNEEIFDAMVSEARAKVAELEEEAVKLVEEEDWPSEADGGDRPETRRNLWGGLSNHPQETEAGIFQADRQDDPGGHGGRVRGDV